MPYTPQASPSATPARPRLPWRRTARRALSLSLITTLVAFLVACDESQRATRTFHFVEATIDDVHRALSEGDMRCVDIIDGYLSRIAAFDASTGLNAVIFTNPRALDRARALDARRARGDAPGELFCVPVLLKDNFDTKDMATSGGSIALKESIPPDDAFMVRRLRDAGAIIIAKTNMAEWAFSPRQTVSSSYGTTANAYALDRVPAGSSGGTASATAASFGLVGMGTDTGNSIRGPSSHLALFGIRSTLGLTSRDGVIPLAWDRDVAGPMTRTVSDGARVFNVVSAHDPADALTRLGRDRHETDYTTFLDAGGLAGRRIGVLRALVDTPEADAQVTELFEQALRDLAAAGAEIVDPVEIENFDAHLDGDYFCPRFRYDMARYLESLGKTAPLRDVNEVLASGQFGPDAERGLRYFSIYPADRPPRAYDAPCLSYPDNAGRRAYRDDVTTAMDRAAVEALVYPSWTTPPTQLDRANEDYAGDNSQRVAPATGLPAASVPMGYSYGHLPAGLQILARPFEEGLIFTLAYAYEQATQHRRPPVGFPELDRRDAAHASGRQ